MNADALTLRARVHAADEAVVERIVRSSGFFSETEVDIAVELVQEHLRHGLASGYHFLFAEDAQGCAGYACYGPSEEMRGWFDLYWIAVDAARRDRGVGGLLLKAVEERVARRRGLGLIVETSGRDLYAPSRGFYEAHGFWSHRVERDHYGPDDDMVVYLKQLMPPHAPRADAP